MIASFVAIRGQKVRYLKERQHLHEELVREVRRSLQHLAQTAFLRLGECDRWERLTCEPRRY
jgi:hypothetical protein